MALTILLEFSATGRSKTVELLGQQTGIDHGQPAWSLWVTAQVRRGQRKTLRLK